MKTVGITGGVGAGKSKVLEYISNNCNCKIVLADELAKELERKGNVCYQALIDLLGSEILDEEGEIIPKAMASKIFADSSLLAKVNEIVHPAVKNAVVEIISDERNKNEIDYFFLEAALLIECGYRDILDELWYIRVTEDVRRIRLKESRGYSDEKIDAIISSQLSDESFIANTDYVIDNSGDFKLTAEQIDKLFSM